jgi:hypothetical protein
MLRDIGAKKDRTREKKWGGTTERDARAGG